MQKIPLQKAEPGMVLAREICRSDSSSNIPICGRDTVLTESLIARLNNMDIKSVYVKGHPIWVAGEKTLEDMLAELDRRFEKTADDPIMSKIHDAYADYLKCAMGDDSGR